MLLQDPKATLEQEFGERIPEGVNVRAVEETADTIYLVLPHGGSSSGHDPEEVSDEDLEAVAGGAGEHATQDTCVSGQNTCNTCSGSWGC